MGWPFTSYTTGSSFSVTSHLTLAILAKVFTLSWAGNTHRLTLSASSAVSLSFWAASCFLRCASCSLRSRSALFSVDSGFRPRLMRTLQQSLPVRQGFYCTALLVQSALSRGAQGPGR